MNKSITEILWEEIKQFFYDVRCQGIEEQKAHDMWCKYQIDLIARIGEEKPHG